MQLGKPLFAMAGLHGFVIQNNRYAASAAPALPLETQRAAPDAARLRQPCWAAEGRALTLRQTSRSSADASLSLRVLE